MLNRIWDIVFSVYGWIGEYLNTFTFIFYSIEVNINNINDKINLNNSDNVRDRPTFPQG